MGPWCHTELPMVIECPGNGDGDLRGGCPRTSRIARSPRPRMSPDILPRSTIAFVRSSDIPSRFRAASIDVHRDESLLHRIDRRCSRTSKSLDPLARGTPRTSRSARSHRSPMSSDIPPPLDHCARLNDLIRAPLWLGPPHRPGPLTAGSASARASPPTSPCAFAPPPNFFSAPFAVHAPPNAILRPSTFSSIFAGRISIHAGPTCPR